MQVVDYAADSRSLEDLRHEIAIYQHLRPEQGVSVPRCMEHGWIRESTCYFLALELLGHSLEEELGAEEGAELPEALQHAALQALQRVHAHRVLHRYVWRMHICTHACRLIIVSNSQRQHNGV